MLQELLANDKDTSRRPTEAHMSPSKPQHPHSNGFSSDSSPSRNSNFLPHYRYHGLAETQTQSQLYDEDEAIHEGSQKENIGTAERNKDLGPLPILRPPSPHSSSPKNPPRRITPVDSRLTNKVRLGYCNHQMYG